MNLAFKLFATYLLLMLQLLLMIAGAQTVGEIIKAESPILLCVYVFIVLPFLIFAFVVVNDMYRNRKIIHEVIDYPILPPKVQRKKCRKTLNQNSKKEKQI